MSQQKVSLDDFGTGILAGFVSNGVSQVHVRNLDEALVKAYESLEQKHPNTLRFHIALHELHGDAPEARKAIGAAVSRGLGYFDNEGRLHIGIPSSYTELYFEHLPLSAEEWHNAAGVALKHLEGQS